MPCPTCGGNVLPNIDMTYALLRTGFCGHLSNPTLEQVDQARGVVARTYTLSTHDACREIAKELGLTPCAKPGCCIVPKAKKAPSPSGAAG